MLVVASEIDPSTERIVQYLSVAGIGVNVVTFEHFTNSDGSERMGRVFLIEPEEVSARASAGSKRRPAATYEELNAIAHQNGVGGLYDNVIEGLGKVFDRRGTTRSSIAFKSRSGASINTIFSLIPGESNSQIGLHFQVYSHRLAEHLGIDVALVLPMLPNDSQDWVYYGSANDEGGHWTGYAGFFKTNTQVDAFLAALS